MSHIRQINRLNSPGIFRDFNWPEKLPPFEAYNLIYGPNGSGKTRLSNIFRDLEHCVTPSNADVELQIDDTGVTGKDFPDQSHLAVCVFNRDFILDNVFPVHQEKGIPLILFLGEKNIEIQRKLKNLREDEPETKSKLKNIIQERDQASKNLASHCSKRAKKIKDTLFEYGLKRYQFYDKQYYEERVNKITLDEDIADLKLDTRTSTDFHILLGEGAKLRMVEIPAPKLLRQSALKRINTIIMQKVASSAIQSLKEDSSLMSWVGNGMALHKKRGSQTCLFCNQFMPQERWTRLEEHFSDVYTHFVKEIEQLIEQCEGAKESIASVSLPRGSEFYSEFQDDYDSTKAAFEETRSERVTFFRTLIEQLQEKKRHPFDAMRPLPEAAEIDSNPVAGLNEVIQRHNQFHSNLESQRIKAAKRLEDDLIVEQLPEFQALKAKEKDFKFKAEDLVRSLSRLENGIQRLESEALEYHQPAKEFNDELQEYLGHDELRLESKADGYQIMRGDNQAKGVSEGERTAIALLYFLKKLKDKRFDLEKGVIVLDDPISSLDSNALHHAFGYIKERTRHAKQLFVMTHNFSFFRMVNDWFIYVSKSKKSKGYRPAKFYMLDRIHGSSPRQTELKPLDPLLQKYEGEYHYLFAQLHRRVHNSCQTSWEWDYSLANMARRLLEIFFAFRLPNIPKSFYKKLWSTRLDESKKICIFRFTNAHSHGNAIDESRHDASILCETESVLRYILELIEIEDKEHFERMVEAVNCTTCHSNILLEN